MWRVFRQNEIHIFARENRAVHGERGTKQCGRREIKVNRTGTGHRGCVLYANNCDPVQTIRFSYALLLRIILKCMRTVVILLLFEMSTPERL